MGFLYALSTNKDCCLEDGVVKHFRSYIGHSASWLIHCWNTPVLNLSAMFIVTAKIAWYIFTTDKSGTHCEWISESLLDTDTFIKYNYFMFVNNTDSFYLLFKNPRVNKIVRKWQFIALPLYTKK